ncbi:MAG: hypothetical protein IPI62_02245 [Bacteroidetes bacterium]|nr:hypothetical protein [Bacteroidota bacterium]
MKLLFSKLFRQHMYEKIPAEDLMARQRFTLFRIYSFTAFIASLFTALQISTSFEQTSYTGILLYMLATLIMVNFFIVKSIHKLPIAYSISIGVGFLVVHTQAYTAGGLMNSGTMYLCVLIMTAFMLLDARAGKVFTGIAILNVIYFFVITEYTSFTNYNLFKGDTSLIHQDALTTFLLGLFLVAAQSNYLNSGKNVIIEKISAQKDELLRNNQKLKEYTASLEKSNSELDRFASIVSHDLKAPLRAIGNLTGWIEEDAGDQMSKEVRTNFDMIKQRVNRMEDLINAILDYSRADRRIGEDEKVDTNKLVIDTLDFIGKPDNAELIFTNQLPVLFSDRTRLSQVFSNLIGNAIKYNDKPDIKVFVSSIETPEGYTFSVKDNGPGIDPLYHERIFVIFQTLNRRDDVESTGVGLAIVKKIVEDCGGKVWVESDLGKGADFKFFWPKNKKNADPVLIAATIVV